MFTIREILCIPSELRAVTYTTSHLNNCRNKANKSKKDKDDILQRITAERQRLYKLVSTNGLNHPQVLVCSRRLDNLIVEIQRSRLELQEVK